MVTKDYGCWGRGGKVEEGEGKMTANGMVFWGARVEEENVLKLIVVMVAGLQFTKAIELCRLGKFCGMWIKPQ